MNKIQLEKQSNRHINFASVAMNLKENNSGGRSILNLSIFDWTVKAQSCSIHEEREQKRSFFVDKSVLHSCLTTKTQDRRVKSTVMTSITHFDVWDCSSVSVVRLLLIEFIDFLQNKRLTRSRWD